MSAYQGESQDGPHLSAKTVSGIGREETRQKEEAEDLGIPELKSNSSRRHQGQRG